MLKSLTITGLQGLWRVNFFLCPYSIANMFSGPFGHCVQCLELNWVQPRKICLLVTSVVLYISPTLPFRCVVLNLIWMHYLVRKGQWFCFIKTILTDFFLCHAKTFFKHFTHESLMYIKYGNCTALEFHLLFVISYLKPVLH